MSFRVRLPDTIVRCRGCNFWRRMNMNNTEDDNNLNSPANQTPRDDDAMRDARRIELLGNAQTSVEKERVRAIVMALQETGVNLSIEDLREIVIDAIYASSAASLESVLSRPLLEAHYHDR